MDDLHTLIKSLSETDKKFFRQYSSLQTNETKYLQLFHAIDAQAEYDEEKIKEQFAGEAFVKQLSVAKNYLNEVILRTFRFTAEKESPEIALQLLLLDIRFLLSKKCFTQMKKAMKRAKKLAEEQENFLVLLNIFSLQRHLFTEFKFEAWENFSLDTTEKEEKEVLRKIENVNTIYDLYCRAKNIVAAEGEKNLSDGSKKLIAEIYRHPLMQNSKTALSIRAGHWYFSARHYKNLIQENYAEGLKNNMEHLQLFEQHPVFAQTRPLSHLTVVNNILECIHMLPLAKNAETYLKKLEQIQTGNEREESGKQLYVAHHSMWYALRKKNFTRAALVAQKELLRMQQDGKTRKDSKIIQYMLIAVTGIITKKYPLTYEAIHQLLAFPKSGIREDLLAYIKLLQIIVFLQEENYNSATDYLRSLQRNATNTPFLKLSCAYFKEILKATDKNKKASVQKIYMNKFKALPEGEMPEIREMQMMLQELVKV